MPILFIPADITQPVTEHELAPKFLQQAYELIDCRLVEAVAGSIQGMHFDVWIDEEGGPLCVDHPVLNQRASLICPGYRLYGNAIVTCCDEKGDTVDLDERLMGAFLVGFAS